MRRTTEEHRRHVDLAGKIGGGARHRRERQVKLIKKIRYTRRKTNARHENMNKFQSTGKTENKEKLDRQEY